MDEATYHYEYGKDMYDEKSKDLDEAQAEIARLQAELTAEKARLSDDEEYQGYRAVNVDGQLYVHIQAHDDAWMAYKTEKALADRAVAAFIKAACHPQYMDQEDLMLIEDHRKAREL